ncbi:LOW QUALITY PROTEIN: hypothetical protein NC652_021269 [Populus alba x Populus x berolinensis]|nr:LOW QUALITY PROTEIN: hypothetical protein NC652_021269 [Populus alba x Populus x berolinensis]
MSWRRVAKSSQGLIAHALLFSFTLLLSFKLDRLYLYLCGYFMQLLHVVGFPYLLRQCPMIAMMCRALMPGDEESMSDEAIWETLPHFWVAISMVFFIAATIFTLLKLCECFAFLVCTKWYNPVIHRHSRNGGPSFHHQQVDMLTGIELDDEDEHQSSGICNPQEIGGHFMKIPFIGFQIMLFMRLEGSPPGAEHIPFLILFAPLLLIQGAGVLFAAYRLVEKIVLLLSIGVGSDALLSLQKLMIILNFLYRGSRLLGWWSIDEGSSEERARLYCAGGSGYNTFSAENVKKKPKTELVDEIRRLHALLIDQTEITKFSQEEYERLQNDKLMWSCFHAGIMPSAALAARSVKSVQSAVSPLKSGCLYMMCRSSCIHKMCISEGSLAACDFR